MALGSNHADGYKSWLMLGIEQPGRDVVAKVEPGWMISLLTEDVLYFLVKYSLILRN